MQLTEIQRIIARVILSPDFYYVGLFSYDDELSGKGYQRQPFDKDEIIFGPATSVWEPICYCAVFDIFGNRVSPFISISHNYAQVSIGDVVHLAGVVNVD